MTSILAIDPGYSQSAWVSYDNGIPTEWGIWNNELVIGQIVNSSADLFVIERIASYGMAVGEEVFETCVWTGCFLQAWKNQHGSVPIRLFRKDIKIHLCGSTRAKDANVRQALIDRYGPSKEVAIGSKKNPGPLYGLSKDCWAALAVAVTADEWFLQPRKNKPRGRSMA